ncbi:MAG: ChbG/HpnK family deacetylase [Desulfobacteraceae bacterium]|nr:ChbG/HpnK family deacetylase [Desulfobacteraceae bacterium]MBC2749797.1 ChbG/HpnK family deacetylase [Desulfobacteraceae bacterium]
MFKIVLLTAVSFVIMISIFFAVWPVPYTKWSGLQIVHMSVNDEETLAEKLGYTRSDILLIVHADDLAIHKDQTDGALDAMQKGLVTTGSVMVPCPDFDRTASIWLSDPNLDLGLHLTLNTGHRPDYRWKPLLPVEKVPSLYSQDGYMWRGLTEFGENLRITEALMEIEAQIKKALSIGLKPTHIDTHMGVYNIHPRLAKGVMKLSRRYNLPMLPSPYHLKEMRDKGYVYPDTIWMYLLIVGEEYFPWHRKRLYDRFLRNLKPGVHELIIHPSFMSNEYEQYVWRPYILTADYAYWTSPDTKVLIDKLGITLIGYRALRRLQAKNWQGRDGY